MKGAMMSLSYARALFQVISICCVVLASPALSYSSDLESGETLQQIENVEDYQAIKDTFRKMWGTFEARTQNRRSDCMRAFGSKRFCDCLAEEAPSILTFEDYIVITTNSKMELNYEELDEDNQKLIDLTRAVRDKCVNESIDQ